MKRSSEMTRVERFATLGMVLLALAFILLVLTGCVSVDAGNLCATVHHGSLLQTGENPVTFDVVVNREIVLRSVTAERIMNECQ